MTVIKPNYPEYITSFEWRNKHPEFLNRSHYRCSFFPFIKCGKKARYNVHHMNYLNLGNERLWVDVIVVCPFVHNFILLENSSKIYDTVILFYLYYHLDPFEVS